MSNNSKSVTDRKEKIRFFLSNLGKGLIWFAGFLVIFILFRKYINIDFLEWLEPIFDNTPLILGIYTISEIAFGIIPPELFMVWALRFGLPGVYVIYILIFALISYGAGILGFIFGSYLETTILFRYIRKRYLKKYQNLVQKFGVFVILVAAITPLPFSAISMLVGSFHYPMKKYAFWALSRFVRYVVYAAIIWEATIF